MRIYRVIPKPVRRRLLATISPAKALSLGRRLVFLRQVPRTVTLAGQTWVRHGARLMPASIDEQATPLLAMRRNFAFVRDALESEGVPYFRVRPTDPFKSSVAVSDDHRTAAIAALVAAAKRSRFQLQSADGRPLRQTRILSVHQPIVAARNSAIQLGTEHACQIELWHRSGDRLIAPQPNAISPDLSADWQPVHGKEWHFTEFAPIREDAPESLTRPEMVQTIATDIEFPIDVVYTWVDGDDPLWQTNKTATLECQKAGSVSELSANPSRYISRDELRYSLRSLHGYAPWVNRVFVVTADQVPTWFDPANDRVTIVSHKDMFEGRGKLPTFNSHAIESQLHHVEGLAEHFIYFNDDMLLGRPILPSAFFHANGVAKFFPSHAQLGADPISLSDSPATIAGKNNRRLICKTFDRVITQKMKHIPYPLLKSVLADIEANFAEEIRTTAEHQFRHAEDVSLVSSLHHYWAFLTKRSVPGRLNLRYVDLAEPYAPAALAHLLDDRYSEIICLNDTDSASVSTADQAALMNAFLPRRYPFVCPAEKSAGTSDSAPKVPQKRVPVDADYRRSQRQGA